MHGDKPEVMDGTQLAADWTFSGLQKFGEGLLDRLRGQRLPNKLLERVSRFLNNQIAPHLRSYVNFSLNKHS